MTWDTARALEVYRTVFPDDPVRPEDHDPREQEIVEEMNSVRNAQTAQEGAEIIGWWGWDHQDMSAIAAARRIRRFKA